MNIVERMVEEIRAEIANGEELEHIKDISHEFIDSYLPVYYNQIIDEWKAMPSEYNDRGSSELGYGEEINIYNLMSLDLYLYYSDLFAEAINEVEESLEIDLAEAINEGAN
jgi:hypothetical protein